MTRFYDFLLERLDAGGFTTEDALTAFLPLLRQVIETHAAGMVAPLAGLNELAVEGGRIWFAEAKRTEPTTSFDRLRTFESQDGGAIEVIERQRRTTDLDEASAQQIDLQIGRRGEEVLQPVYLPGYVTWEHEIDHHDPLTDVFSLGMILASLACGLDLHDPAQLERFVRHRRNLFAVKPDLHPVLAQAIVRTTELDRHRRPPELQRLLSTLENYREQDVDIDIDLARVEGFASRDLDGKHQIVLAKLQERLFEISRRNRLLHFRPTLQSVNLTQSSVPLSFDVRTIRPEQILTWNERLHRAAASGKPLSLGKHLNFREALYLPGTLDHIRAEANRDEKEFGFAQLRLVPCFLRWANLKEDPPEQFDSPLVLLPAKLTKKKGIRDTYHLEITSPQAEINPVVRHQLKQLYDIELPETFDLESHTLEDLYGYLARQIEAAGSGVSLAKVDRPRIDLIHEQARRRLDQYRRNARIGGRGVRTFLDIEYSYDPANYHPLGLKLFDRLIRTPTTRIQEILEERPRPRTHAVSPAEESHAVREREFYRLRERESDNPYAWEFDLCSVTLGNFKYRKMSLVRDYTALLEGGVDNPAFDAIFSLVPRPVEDRPIEPPPLKERYHVVPCDPTQAAAVARAQSGASYIIQGPPGTGKSQTITNLIADYVARGERVLFVCEKRAAIDVVFLRLRQQGLDELCSLIHDSQADKKAFVMNLKQTYETFLGEAVDGRENGERRSEQLAELSRELGPLERVSSAMTAVHGAAGCSTRDLLDRAVSLREELPELSPLAQERLPEYRVWREYREAVDSARAALEDVQPDGVLARHPLCRISTRLVDVPRPLELVTTELAGARECLERIEAERSGAGLPPDSWSAPEKLRHLARYAARVDSLASAGQALLLDAGSEPAREFQARLAQVEEARRELEQIRERTQHWKEKLPPEELKPAREQAHALEGRLLSVLRPVWWRLRKVLRRCYDFSAHVIKPSWSQVLDALDDEYRASGEFEKADAALRSEYGLEEPAAEFAARLEESRAAIADMPEHVQPLHGRLLAGEDVQREVQALLAARSDLDRMERHFDAFLEDYQGMTLDELATILSAVEAALDRLPDFLYVLGRLARLPRPLLTALRTHELTFAQLEAATADATLMQILRADPAVARFTATQRDRHAGRLEQQVAAWQKSNARCVRNRARDAFLENIRITSQPAGDLSDEQRELKKRYDRGRKELEHEFGKKMRYKSIRDLVSGDSGLVVRDLKPVWLMSPLSVADTLPLDRDAFDVVIFDEASQITLEEAIPSIFRARQAIVVGDEMQLPPTNFFSAKRSEEEEQVLFPDEDEVIQYALDTDSLLSHAARNLSSTMLGWHYRSRSESLISFSNGAFYAGRWLTVPEEQVAAERQVELLCREPEQGAVHAEEVLRRPISFHFMERGVYERRKNRTEADYIAHLVQALLLSGRGLSIGVVAFSEAQQGEIESSLARLADEDRAFRDALEAEWEREEDGQFVGLLVKNLENIQGDERDVVIMSVCYGYNRDGEMRMNFGPINVSGGEKRLNVAFSRAKHHMVLVSSVRYTDIKNDYNDGANCLKNYLRYAEAASAGRMDLAERVLAELALWRGAAPAASDTEEDTVTRQIAAALEQRGYLVETGIGQSHFRCNLGVRKEGDAKFRLGVLIDTPDYYERSDLLEREMMKPKLLRDFGWRIRHVLAKEWYQDRTSVLEQLVELIEQSEDSRRLPPRSEAEEE